MERQAPKLGLAKDARHGFAREPPAGVGREAHGPVLPDRQVGRGEEGSRADLQGLGCEESGVERGGFDPGCEEHTTQLRLGGDANRAWIETDGRRGSGLPIPGPISSPVRRD
jgi:hypothetical protein